jgi:Zn-dependent protease with chaperone function
MSKASISASEGVDGVFHAAGGVPGARARLLVSAAGVARVETGGAPFAQAPLAELDISDRLGSVARRVAFPDGGLFETDDNDGIDRLLGRKGPGLVASLERFHPRLALLVVLVLLLGAGVYQYAVPVLVEVAVAITPPAVPALMSKGTLESLDAAVFEPTTLEKERQRALLEGFNALARLTPRGIDGYVLHFRRGGSIGPNAFALPDGAVVLTDELVALAGKDDEMIFGVFAHELGHVEHEDALRRLYRAAGVAGLIMLIGGDIGSGAEDVLVQGAGLATLSYSRGQEAAADRYSVDLMYRAGKDPAAIARFFRVLMEKLDDKGMNDFFSTHPATEGRAQEVERLAKELAAL